MADVTREDPLRLAAQARLAAIVESSDDAIVCKTLDGIIRRWNKGAERIFGYTADEIVGKPITHASSRPTATTRSREILARLRGGERVDHFETIRQTKDGRLIDVSVTISPIRDATGRIVGASKIARDITAAKAARAAARTPPRRAARGRRTPPRPPTAPRTSSSASCRTSCARR